MKFNVAKCHSMRVTRHYTHKQIIHDYTLHQQTLENVQSAKYFGITITENMDWGQHISLTGCPLCRESHPLCRLKNPTVISIWLLVGFHPATRSVQSTPADNTRKRVWQYIEKERKVSFEETWLLT